MYIFSYLRLLMWKGMIKDHASSPRDTLRLYLKPRRSLIVIIFSSIINNNIYLSSLPEFLHSIGIGTIALRDLCDHPGITEFQNCNSRIADFLKQVQNYFSELFSSHFRILNPVIEEASSLKKCEIVVQTILTGSVHLPKKKKKISNRSAIHSCRHH